MINTKFYSRTVYEFHINTMVTYWSNFYSLDHINELLSEYTELFAY